MTLLTQIDQVDYFSITIIDESTDIMNVAILADFVRYAGYYVYTKNHAAAN